MSEEVPSFTRVSRIDGLESPSRNLLLIFAKSRYDYAALKDICVSYGLFHFPKKVLKIYFE